MKSDVMQRIDAIANKLRADIARNKVCNPKWLPAREHHKAKDVFIDYQVDQHEHKKAKAMSHYFNRLLEH